jgi:hypothetical protein
VGIHQPAVPLRVTLHSNKKRGGYSLSLKSIAICNIEILRKFSILAFILTSSYLLSQAIILKTF